MHHDHLNRAPHSIRRGLYLVLFVCLTLTAVYTAGPTLDARASEGVEPAGGTIPPDGTIPGPQIGQINVLHLAPFASDVADTGVQICTGPSAPVTDVFFYEEETGYQNYAVGTYNWKVALEGSDCSTVVLEVPEFRLRDQARLLLIIHGDITNQPLSSTLVIVDEGLDSTYLPLIYRSLVDQSPP
jgi:hypothetical protein